MAFGPGLLGVVGSLAGFALPVGGIGAGGWRGANGCAESVSSAVAVVGWDEHGAIALAAGAGCGSCCSAFVGAGTGCSDWRRWRAGLGPEGNWWARDCAVSRREDTPDMYALADLMLLFRNVSFGCVILLLGSEFSIVI